MRMDTQIERLADGEDLATARPSSPRLSTELGGTLSVRDSDGGRSPVTVEVAVEPTPDEL